MSGTTQPQNKAAWLKKPKAPRLEVDDATYKQPGDHELIIKNKAVAINPVDWVVQLMDIFPDQKYPALLGCDMAGEVIQVGPNVTRFQVGDRVVACAQGLAENNGSFQLYPSIDEHTTVKIPDNLSFAQASAIPLGFITSAALLYNILDLPRPKVDPVTKPGKVVIVWAGSSSVGFNAIQFAKASGFEVITTCSLHNFAILKEIGADHVFDYNSDSLEADLFKVLEGKELAGTADCGTRPNGTHDICVKVVAAVKGRKDIACALTNKNELPEGVKAHWVNADIVRRTPVAKAIFEDYLEPALAQDKFTAGPKAEVVGNGLESIQEAMNIQFKGVSGKKIVVTL